MTNGKRNRAAGQGWERKLAETFRVLGYKHVVTSRSESKSRDDKKVDLMNKDERVNGQFVLNVQAKNAVGHLKYGKILSEMPEEKGVINCIIHKQTKKTNNRFIQTGEYVMLSLSDFLLLFQAAGNGNILTTKQLLQYDQPTKTVG